MRQIILDTETTGLNVTDGHRIIEIGCIELINRKITGKKFHYFLNPDREIDEGARAVHGISTEFLQDKPRFGDIAEELISFINDAELIIHNAPFDTAFINHEFSLAGFNKTVADCCRVMDTLVLARKLHVGQRNSLDALCKRYQVDASGREFHGALLDAHLLTDVYLAMTGGQGSLFEDFAPEEKTTQAEVKTRLKKVRPQTTVLKATPEELAEHQAIVEKMAAKGKCLFTEPRAN